MSQQNIISIDPVTRIEGHLGVKVAVEGEKKGKAQVVDAWSSGLLWRGFEHILLGRDPRDAPTITSRICGVCHAVHRLTSILALEDADSNLTPNDIPPNAIRIRNIQQGINFVYSHAAHIFVLAGPDYDLYGLVPGLSEGKNLNVYHAILKEVVLPAQRLCHEIAAIFGGKVPHHMTTVPGGVTCVPNEASIMEAQTRMNTIKNVINQYAPTVLDFLKNRRSELEDFGGGYGNFLSYGVFPDPEHPEDLKKFLLKRGVIIDGEAQSLDINKITEAVKNSWYTDDSGGNPSEEPPPKDHYGKNGAYSWVKSPRYDGNVCEAGPLARMAVSGYYPANASVYDRLMARASELVLVLNETEKWIEDLEPDSVVYVEYENPKSATGTGLWEAPRGCNGHWVNIKGGKIERYQVVSPTNWNASPRDDHVPPQLGPMEQALIGVPVTDQENPVNVYKTIRSFDPCLACSVHVIKMESENTPV
ncbi:nickel-dependent hydrogenase large subunit [[Eubacterium] cellulosolvens]